MPVTSQSQPAEQPWRSTTFDRLMASARMRPEAVALRHKTRGAWTAWTWRSVVGEVDRFAAALQHLGVRPGDGVALSGEIGPHLLLLALAARVVGASAAALPLRPSPAATSRRPPWRVAVVQRRDALLPWIDAAERAGATTTILFDHATPDGTTPHRAVLTVAAAREIAALRGWADALGTPSRPADPAPSTWIEETTDWPEVFDVTLDAWLTTGGTLACPELLAAAARDRRDIQPDRWIVSRDRLAAAAAEIDARLPAETTASGRIVAQALRSPSHGPARALVRSLLRRHLGLSGLAVIDVDGPAHLGGWPAPAVAALRLFEALGVAARTATDATAGDWRGPEPAQAGTLGLAGQAR